MRQSKNIHVQKKKQKSICIKNRLHMRCSLKVKSQWVFYFFLNFTQDYHVTLLFFKYSSFERWYLSSQLVCENLYIINDAFLYFNRLNFNLNSMVNMAISILQPSWRYFFNGLSPVLLAASKGGWYGLTLAKRLLLAIHK